ncbi:hypothetical protein [Halobacillus mangrovi]|uniref:Uncharacterized protein n=1 Tax=Halobacillus mangrovi TaxID=402384 RepID=A0A1W5ZY87_9BACI|nr:hypothetical protein [Halobacillus mangrovi]ARI78229.1 hypothetical protein HM131_15830 [Halobacillus mangrovi]
MNTEHLPTKAYKYMKEKWLKKLEATHSIRITPLKDYSETIYGSEIGDDFEGKSRTNIAVDDLTIEAQSQTSKEKEILNSHRIHIRDKATITFENSNFITDNIDNNYFVYCVSLERKPNIQRAFGSGLQTIYNFPQFFKHLEAELAKSGIVFHDAGECVYLPKREQKYHFKDLTEREGETLIHKPYFVKDKRYEYQREFRLIWKFADNRQIKWPFMTANLDVASLHYKTEVLKPATQKKKKKRVR